MPYYEYDSEFLAFIDAFYQSGLLVSNYQDLLEQMIPDWQTVDIKEVVKTADFELTKTILTKCIRVERFSDGAWYNAIRSGLFLDILRRMNALREI